MKKKIIIAVAVVVLLAGLTLLITLLPESEEPAPEASGTPDVSLEPVETAYVINDQFSKFDHIKVYDEAGEYLNTMLAETDGEGVISYRVEPAREGWTYDEEAMRSSAASAATLSAMSVVAESMDDPAQYGLDKPQWTVEISFDGGARVYTIEVGAPTALENSYYCSNGDGRVYAVGAYSVSQITRGEMSYRTYEFFPDYYDEDALAVVTDGAITYVRACDPATGYDMLVRKVEEGEFENPQTDLYMESPYEGFCVDAQVESYLINPAVSIKVNGIFLDDPSEAELSEYGFDTPREVWIKNADGDEVHYTIGMTVGTNCYIMVEGVNTILTAEGVSEALFNVDYVDLLFKMLVTESVRDIATVEFETPSGDHTLEMTFDPPTDDNPSGTVFGSFDGEAISSANTSRMYARVLAVQVYEAYDVETTTVPAAPEYTFTITRNDGRVVELALYRLNDRRFAAYLNGEPTGFAVHRDPLLEIEAAFEVLADGLELTRLV